MNYEAILTVKIIMTAVEHFVLHVPPKILRLLSRYHRDKRFHDIIIDKKNIEKIIYFRLYLFLYLKNIF